MNQPPMTLRQTFQLGWALLLMIWSAAALAVAGTEYWIVIGTFNTVDRAERARERASLELDEVLDVQGVDTAGDYLYRVVAGPFQTEELAQSVVAHAKQQGYDNAWMITRFDQPAFAGAGAASNAGFGPSSGSGRFEGRYDSGLNRRDSADADQLTIPQTTPMPSYDRQITARFPIESEMARHYPEQPVATPESNQHERPPALIETAPTNYALHKLRRDETQR